MKQTWNYLFSRQVMGFLLIIIAVSLATATFIENDFGTTVAHHLVYDAKWFELLLLLFTVNLTGSIFHNKLYKRGKWPIFLFHISFIIILLGSAVTRYIGFEGSIHLREGDNTNIIVSSKTSIDIIATRGNQTQTQEHFFQPLNPKNIATYFDFNNEKIEVNLKNYIPHAKRALKQTPAGHPVIDIIVVEKGKMQNMQSHILEMGQKTQIGEYQFAFSSVPSSNCLTFLYTDTLRICAPFAIKAISMTKGHEDLLEAKTNHVIEIGKIYAINGTRFLIRKFHPSAQYQYIRGENTNTPDILVFNIKDETKSKDLILEGHNNQTGSPISLAFNGTNFTFCYGAHPIKLPFYLYLNDFKLERYPGSSSPSSFASEVTLRDSINNIEKNYQIYMNNVLKYAGFRFYQASYDPDEKGSTLTVNHDQWGMMITYAGYFLMVLGMIFSLTIKNSRFSKLSRLTKTRGKGTRKAMVISLFLMALSFSASAQNSYWQSQAIPLKQSRAFCQVLVQDKGGRIKPINTLASEVLRKISGKDKFMGLHCDQVFLSMIAKPQIWQKAPLIKISNDQLAKIIGINGKRAKFLDFITEKGNYKLGGRVQQAYAKKPSQRDAMDKEIIKADERINICYMVFTGEFLKIYPSSLQKEKPWQKYSEVLNMPKQDSLFVKNSFPLYLQHLTNKEYDKAQQYLGAIKIFQHNNGGDILPSKRKQRIEILYNDISPFKKLFPIYMVTGILLLGALITKIIRPKFSIVWWVKITLGILIVAFACHSAGLAGRWYISGHAPWSNGYESMTYVAWASVLAGFIFVSRSPFTLAATAILAGITLFVAHLSWMSPEVTNLVPVLKSYWLTIHVAVITASYGFLALGAILGFINLLIMILMSSKNSTDTLKIISNLTHISEMTLTIGLYFLTTGTILGAVWANESWGRYWGWDPKETWALITILVYGFVIHMRKIPGMNTVYAFNLASVVSYSSVLMTYFGVNYYLSGLHSYAKGDPVPVPIWVYYAIATLAIITIVAYYRQRKKGTVVISYES